MVSADNLNLDCLELIFAHLSGNDLVSVSLVSRSFLAGVVRRLYRALFFHVGNAKRWPKIMSPFDVIVIHPSLAGHVRSIDIRITPLVKGTYHPQFLNSCSQTIKLATNLRSFTCTPNILASFLPALETVPDLESIRANATLTHEQTKYLISLKRLKNLSLDSCSWNVVDILPNWARLVQQTLRTLTFNAVPELHDQILNTILRELPNLTSLHVIACTKVEHATVFKAVAHTPLLENLAVTTWDTRALQIELPALPRLRHLTLDTHITVSVGQPPVDTPPLWRSILAATHSWSCPLESITFKLSDRWPISDLFVHELVDAHKHTLKHIALLDCDLSVDSIRMIAASCAELQRLAVYIPKKDLLSFSAALSRSRSLRILHDIGESHSHHGVRATLTRESVRTIMEIIPQLRRVGADGRVWTCEKGPRWVDEGFKIKLERRKIFSPHHWFLPPLGFS